MPACATCGGQPPPTAKFCPDCGAALAVTCSACGAPVAGKFCAECGTPASAVAVPRQTSASPRVAERRVTSVLFGDLVGFTTLSESRDPEQVRELLSRYFATARTVIERYGGTVEKFIGDAVMAVWGVPAAMEDDAERAVRAGLDVVTAITALGEEIGAHGLSMRVGIVTGEVAVTLGATGEGMVAGDAVNTAARVQSSARPGEVWVDDETRALTVASVAYADAGTHELKGKREALPLYVAKQVIAVVGGSRRVDGLEAPFVGRDRDLRMVKELFHATLEEKRPRLVSVIGAAGIGKSRLGWEFDKYSDGIAPVVTWHRGRCLAYGDGVAFWALAEMVRMRIGAVEGASPAAVLDQLRAALPDYVADEEERDWLLPRLATLLGVAHLAAPGTTFARDELFAAWRLYFERLAGAADGCVFVVDDVQWADDALLDFFEDLVESAQAPIFILTFSRPELAERRPRWGSLRRIHVLHLEPLPDAVMSELVDGLVDGLPAATRAQLVARAEGVPLYAVETIRALIDRDAVVPREGRYVLAADVEQRLDLDALAAPTSLHNLIAARLDALPDQERRLVQDAAVLGQSFTRAGLAALAAATGMVDDVDELLAALVRKEIFAVEADPRSPERGQYRFVQALVRTVAYDTLSHRDRKSRHLAAAHLLEAEPDAEVLPAVVASHYLDARNAMPEDADADELAAQALRLLEQAGERAAALGAHGEARRHYVAAHALATNDSDAGRLAEGAAVAMAQTSEAADALLWCARARDAYIRADLPVDAARALAVWGETQINNGVTDGIVEPLSAAYDDIIDRAGSEQVASQLALQIARSLYMTQVPTPEALQWFDRSVTLAEAIEDTPSLIRAMSSYGGALMIVGRPTMGLGLLQVALQVARRLGINPVALSPLNNLTAFLVTRDLHSAREYADEALALARRVGHRGIGPFLYPNYLYVLWLSGDWDAAAPFWREMSGDRPVRSADLPPMAFLNLIASARGETGEDVPLDETTPGPDAPGLGCFHQLVTALALAATGAAASAAQHALAALDKYLEVAGLDDDFSIFWVTAFDLCIDADDVDNARRLVDVVATAPPGKVTPYLRGQLPRMQAMLGMATGDDSIDIDGLLTQAEVLLRLFGAPFYLGKALLAHAEWHVLNGSGAAAQPLLDEAQNIFGELRARPWLDRAISAQTLVVT